MKVFSIVSIVLGLSVLISCSIENRPVTNSHSLFDQSNLIAWCIVPFDSEERSPEERAAMLQELGISQLAYDWRQQHLPTFEAELEALKKHNIDLRAVWFWIDQDSVGYLGEDNETLWDKMVANEVRTECWFSFSPQYFEGLSDEEKRQRAIRFIADFRKRAKQQNCTLGMYNHGDWFGNPINQLAIIDSLGSDHLGMVYNFHHAHHEINEFPALLEKMQDHLLCINLNGMVEGGEKIVALGEGDRELEMLQAIQNSNYRGPIGIIGHQDRDVKEVLVQNLRGLNQLKAELK
ncbi:TIM barrel protein [Tunicatimonas pelagia]|uniref:TIM barrel protein n=1 Tax=Tunicatimonas pelagia TaxID=931531 RepID=UPI002665865E|nr:TIM barrel protein [Tunicatimonas pelagia]WKN43577.1 xylose isomerase [Tunicatimonas pelagia]